MRPPGAATGSTGDETTTFKSGVLIVAGATLSMRPRFLSFSNAPSEREVEWLAVVVATLVVDETECIGRWNDIVGLLAGFGSEL